MKKLLKKVCLVVLAVAFCVLENIVIDALKLPRVGVQISLLGVAYYMGPVYGLIAACLAGVGNYFISADSLTWLFPILIGVIFCGLLGKYKRFLDKINDTIALIFFIGLIEGVVLAIAEGIILNGGTVMNYTDNIIAMLSHYNYPLILGYLVGGIFTVYPDVTLCFLLMWICHRIVSSSKKKKALIQSTAGIGAVIFAVMSIQFCFPITAEAGTDTNYISKRFDSTNGLAGGTANDIAQTSDGRMWVATYEGLYSFNGKKLDPITNIPNVRSIVSLYVAEDDSLWIGNNGTGLVVMRPDGSSAKLDVYDGLPSDSVREIKQFNDKLFYIATAKGLAIVAYDGVTLSVRDVIAENQYINQIAIASDGTVAFFSSDKKVYLLRDGVIFQYLSGISGDITSIHFDDDDILYVGESSNTIYLYSNNDDTFEMVGEIDTGDIISVSDLCFSEDAIYVAAQNGLGYIDENGKFNPLYVDNYSSNIGHVIEDYQGNVWFTSSRHGLLCLEKSVFMDVFSLCDAPEGVVNSEVEWNGLLYVGTDKGLLALDIEKGENVSNELTELYGMGYRIRCVNVDSNNSLWISIYDYATIEVTQNGEIYTYTDGVDDFDIGTRARFTVEKSDGTMMISHNAGVAFVKNHKVVKQLVCGKEMCSAYALTIIEKSDGTLLFGTDGEGIWVYKDGEFTQSVTRKEGISSGVILRMVEDPYADGTFVLTGSGLCYLNSDYSAFELEGFPYYNNLDLWISDNKTVFVLSSAGIFVGNYEGLISGKGNFTLMDSAYGLNSSLTSNPWNYLANNRLYLASNNGVYALDVRNYKRSVSKYKPMIASVSIDDNMVKMDSKDEIFIPGGNHKITLKMDINNFTSENPYVRYFLLNVDKTKKVCKSSDLSEVTYENLSHGEYSFYVEVLDAERNNAIAQKVFKIIKGSEPYETVGFMVVFYVTLGWIVISLIITIVTIAINISAAKQKSSYEKMLSKLEREKAQALELALQKEEQANKSKSDFLASMSHEIRTPINAIIGMDTMILRETNQGEIRGYANNVKSASETLLALINDILDFSKIESGKMELVLDDYDISSVINDLVNMIKPKANAKGLDLQISIDPEIPAVLYGDSVRIKQIILNILNNAVKYTESGHIKMEMKSEKTDDNQIELGVRISDTGIGIKEEDIHKLFSPYERIEENRNKNVEGTGLGMSITKTLLGLMNSSLQVESEYGKGSVFSFTILQPVKSEDVIGNYEERLKNSEDGNADVEAFHAPEAEILVVDDVEMNLIVATSLLKRTLIKITTASSGKEAIAISTSKKFDVILLDSMMPEMSGEETLKAIKAECDLNKDTPVIVLTANAIKGAKDEYLKAGFDNYLSKPIDGSKLEAMLKAYIPEEKIITDFEKYVPESEAVENASSETSGASSNPDIEKLKKINGIDVAKGIETSGNEDVYLVVCKNFYDTAYGRIEMLEKHYREMDVANYTIQVHALKSSAKLIGAFELSDDALEMEMAGREDNKALISEKTDHIISEYRRILFEMDEIFSGSEDDNDKPEMTEKKLKRNLSDLLELVEGFDFSTASELFDSFSEYKLPADFKPSYIKLRGRFAEVDHDGIVEIIGGYLGQ